MILNLLLMTMQISLNTPKSCESHRHFYKYVVNLSCRAESGFRHVEPKKYTPRLLHVFGEKVKGFSILND